MNVQENREQNTFEQYLKSSVHEKRYVKLQYFTAIREFFTITAVTTDIFEKGDASFLALNTGDEIPLDKIVKIDDVYSPEYAHIDDYTCDC
ncbi:hypothetical protein [Catalinimonas niigatensis]|uniref:hypothetical protein n=1 Tax=Catalinimonas niigatensis TaxID=1397264 RepID=UPI002666CB65|nr:hypothetical protein [Catalinimonas niigatensis]WPP50713.1 hypothetical protein PZB72_29040 [Catalinimonas niigatensis]